MDILLLNKAIESQTNSSEFSLEIPENAPIDDYIIIWNEEGIEDPERSAVLTEYNQLKSEATSPEAIALEQINKAYELHEQNGLKYFKTVRNKLVLAYKSGQYTAEQCAAIEKALDPVKSKVITGDWLSASFAIAETVTDTNYTEELKTSITADIQNYINENY